MTPAELTRHIPPEVVEAAARAYAVAHDTPELRWTVYAERVAIALAAGLAAWNGSSHLEENDTASIRGVACLILPLPEEGADE
jgi:hypothetical protein